MRNISNYLWAHPTTQLTTKTHIQYILINDWGRWLKKVYLSHLQSLIFSYKLYLYVLTFIVTIFNCYGYYDRIFIQGNDWNWTAFDSSCLQFECMYLVFTMDQYCIAIRLNQLVPIHGPLPLSMPMPYHITFLFMACNHFGNTNDGSPIIKQFFLTSLPIYPLRKLKWFMGYFS